MIPFIRLAAYAAVIGLPWITIIVAGVLLYGCTVAGL